jgi:hypothetical protein
MSPPQVLAQVPARTRWLLEAPVVPTLVRLSVPNLLNLAAISDGLRCRARGRRNDRSYVWITGADLVARNTTSGRSAYLCSITTRTACLNSARPAASISTISTP